MPNLLDQGLSRRALAQRLGRLDAVAGVRLATLGDGAERGVRVLEFRTGTGLDFEVMVDRCMDVARSATGGRRSAGSRRPGSVPPGCTTRRASGASGSCGPSPAS